MSKMNERERREADLAELLNLVADKIDDGRRKHDHHATEIRSMAMDIRHGMTACDNTRDLSDLGCARED